MDALSSPPTAVLAESPADADRRIQIETGSYMSFADLSKLDTRYMHVCVFMGHLSNLFVSSLDVDSQLLRRRLGPTKVVTTLLAIIAILQAHLVHVTLCLRI